MPDSQDQIISDYAHGKLDIDELERRLELVPVDDAPPSLALVPAQHLRVVMSSVDRTGPWAVPQELAARVLWGNLLLDLREARLAADTTIEVDVTMGNVEVIVPPGVAVEVGASSFLGNIEDRTERFGATGPTVRIVGRVKLGNLELSTRRPGETRRDARRRRRAERRAYRRWRRAVRYFA